ncbi:siroheme decarboxylase subunit beta [Alkalimarinus alittae]|uniref:siroheme decarboxylase n=1 Tax=Alkalimarinus alittae TaxID=2961619 RepID=A0ABY6N608_9ALTE|nr:hypothetical protein [Alkalimarinus alittae]UZE97514.1 hypothetical protein NKI27_07155 [Alkalimarinus alittae]
MTNKNNISTFSDQPTLSERQQQALKCAIQEGLPIDARPYLVLANIIGGNEQQVINCIEEWINNGLIKRFGLVIKHHKLGYNANAMVVWNVPDQQVDEIGERIKQSGLVTLCYRRPRRLPEWNYNLFCMIHGKDRNQVLDQLNQLKDACQLSDIKHDILFSYKQFKQCGGRFHKQHSEPHATQWDPNKKAINHG